MTDLRRTPLRRLLLLSALMGGASLVEDTATGNPVTFETDVAKPLVSLIANFLPVQASGTPAPDNILPITGWDAVKVWKNKGVSVPIEWDAESDGKYIGADGTIGNSSSFHYSDLLPVIKGNYRYTFTASGFSTNRNTRIHGYNSQGQWVEQLTWENTENGTYYMDFVVPVGIDYIRISNAKNVTNESIIETQETDISFPSTIYGGYVDMVTGEVWKTWETVDMGSLRWLATGTSTTGVYRMYTPSLADVIEVPESNSVVGKVMCSVYQTRSADSTYSKNMGVSVGSNKSVMVYDTDYNEETSVDDFKTSVTGQTLAYGLASPVLITTLTPQQINAIKGNNAVWSDANSDCEVTYYKKG